MIAMAAVLCILPVAARERVVYDISELPQAARVTLNKFFKGTKVNHIKIETGLFGGTEYEVTLDNGCEIEFDGKGNYTEVDCGYRGVPDNLLLKSIRDYVNKNYNGQKIGKLKVKKNKYEVELMNGTELEFDRSGRFLREDR